jgi:hypothetical protein
VVFEANRGQAPAEFVFVSRGHGYTLGIGHRYATVLAGGRSWTIRLLPSASKVRAAGPPAGIAALPGRSNYFLGNRKIEDLPQFSAVRQQEVYPAIDVVWHGSGRQLEYDFQVQPGADPRQIRMRFEGVDRVQLNEGDLWLTAGGSRFRLPKPTVYQDTRTGRRHIAGSYRLDSGTVSFDVGEYDRTAVLVIDPVLVWSAVVGGSADDAASAVATDSAGNVYITGRTASLDFPTQSPRQAASGGSTDVFVTKLNASGTAVVYSTYLGGAAEDEGKGIAVDSAGNAYVTGFTSSSNFPTQSPAQAASGGARDAFILKLAPAGNTLVYSTYFGGFSFDNASAIAIDTAGNAYVTGSTSGTVPVVGAVQPASGGFTDAFVTKLNAAGTAYVYTTHLGGSAIDDGNGIAVTAAGEATVTGTTFSANFPVKNAKQPAIGGASVANAFVTRFNAAGNAHLFSTYLGGAGPSSGAAVAVAPDGTTYVTGTASSANFPLKNAAQAAYGGNGDAFVTAFQPSGADHVFSTFLGGSGSDFATAISATANGVAVGGSSGSVDFTLSGSLRTLLSPVHRSLDSGGTWQGRPFPGAAVAIAAHPTDANTAYVATERAVYRTTDGGATWSQRTSAATDFVSLAVDPADPCRIVAGLRGTANWFPPSPVPTIFGPVGAESTDCGNTWTQTSPNPEFYRLGHQFAPTSPPTLYYVSGLAQISGNFLLEVPMMCIQIGANKICSTGVRPGVIAVDTANPCTTYHGSIDAFGSFRGVLSRNTNCTTPSYQSYGTVPGTILSLAHHPTDGQTLVAGLADGTVYRRIGTGGAWTLAATLDGGVSSLAFSSGGVLYAGTRSGTVYKSTNAGATFTPTAYAGPNLGALALQGTSNVWAASREISDAFVTVLTSSGAITYSTLHGGSGADTVRGVVLRSGGEVIAAGDTGSSDIPIAGGGYGVNRSGNTDAFALRLDPLTCTYSLTPGPNSVTVTAPAGCAWTAVSNAAWITITGGASGSGNGTVTYTVAPNPNPSPRSGTITIAGQTIAIEQAGVSCTYSLTPASASPSSAGGAASFTVNTPAGCGWTAAPNAAWITISSGASGSGPGTVNYSVAANGASTQRSGAIVVAGVSFAITQQGAGTVVNPIPSTGVPNPQAGSGSTRAFTFTFNDANGASDLFVLNVLINNAIEGRNSCYLAYLPSGPASGTLVLVNDAGDAGGPFAGTLALPGSGIIANSQCSVNGAGSSASMSGNTLTLTLNMTFAAGYSGNRVVYAAARDLGGNNSGWHAKGVWNVPGAAPQPTRVTSLSPSSASSSTVTLTAQFADDTGFGDLSVLNLLIHDAIDGRNACYVAFVQSIGTLVLVNNAGDAGGPFAGAVTIPGTGTAANSQCTIAAAQSSVSGAGNTLTLTLRITFAGSFAGDRIVYAAARDNSGNNSGWQALGTISVP